MNCTKCGTRSVSLYGVPTGRFAYMPDPLAAKWCYDCWVQDYGSEEELAEWIEERKIDRAIEADAFPNK